MGSAVHNGDYNRAYFYHNDQQIPETNIQTHIGSASVRVDSTGGREVFIQAQAGDTISLRTERVDFSFYRTLTCFQFNAV